MLNNKKAVIFDLDGSLVDSMWVWIHVDKIFMEKYNITPPTDYHKAIEGMSYTETAQYFVDTFPTLDLTVDEIKDEWTNMTKDLYKNDVCLKEGAFEFLETMRRDGVQLGIATSNSRELAETVLRSLRILHYFASIRTSCEVEAGKPAPDVYLKVAEDIGVRPQNCLVFEDVPKGIEAGKKAGMTVCAVDDEFSRHLDAEKKLLADYFIHDYSDIKNHTFEYCGC